MAANHNETETAGQTIWNATVLLLQLGQLVMAGLLYWLARAIRRDQRGDLRAPVAVVGAAWLLASLPAGAAAGAACPLQMIRGPAAALAYPLTTLATLAAWKSQLVAAIPVYDCEHELATHEIVDLHEAAPCPDPELDYEVPYNATVQVLQTETELPVEGHACHVVLTREVTRCGFNSITYGHSTPIWGQVVEIPPQDCRHAAATGVAKVDGRAFNATLGVRLDASYFSHGKVDENGNCETESFMSGNLWFDKSYEKTKLQITLRRIRGTADTSTGAVSFHNGLQGRWKDEVLRDAFEGTIVWEAKDPPCDATVSEIYLGRAAIHRRNGAGNVRGAVVMVAGGQRGDQYAGLVVKQPTSLCGAHCYQTQIASVQVCILREGDAPLPPHTFKASFKQAKVGMQTEVGHLHLGTNMRMHARFAEVQGDLCDLDRRVTHSRLQAVAAADNPYALLDTYGPGHEITVAGAVAYVTKCVAVDAQKASYANCTEEVPVSINGTLRFANPLLWTLTDFPTVVPCSDLMPVRWLLQGQWYCASPQLRPCHRPQQLEPTVSPYQPTGDITQGLGRGAYTAEQKAEHARFVRSWKGRRAVTARDANAAVDNSLGNGLLGSTLGPRDVEEIKWTVASFLCPWVPVLGEAWTWISGAMLLAMGVSLLLSCAVRVLVIYYERGFGLWMLGAVFNVVYTLARVPPALVRAALHIAREGMHQGIPMPPPRGHGAGGGHPPGPDGPAAGAAAPAGGAAAAAKEEEEPVVVVHVPEPPPNYAALGQEAELHGRQILRLVQPDPPVGPPAPAAGPAAGAAARAAIEPAAEPAAANRQGAAEDLVAAADPPAGAAAAGPPAAGANQLLRDLGVLPAAAAAAALGPMHPEPGQPGYPGRP